MKKLVKSALFLGAGGVSMSKIAKAYITKGIVVYCYDRSMSNALCELSNLGAKITTRFNREFCNVDICICTPAIPRDNKYVLKLKERHIPIIDRAEALDNLCRQFKTVIAVAGTHGKSTTSALIYNILREDGRLVSCHVGANVDNERFDPSDDYIVVEACEYNKSFLSLHPDVVAITNVEPDHMDTYKNMFDLRTSFIKFIKRAKYRFASMSSSTKFLEKLRSVSMIECNKVMKTNLIGEYNQQNINLARAVCLSLGVGEDVISSAVSKFVGLPNRDELIGKFHEADVYIDYAHHPTEIECFCNAFSDMDKNRVQIIFQPHTYSRTKYLLSEFVKVLTSIDDLVIYKEYPARETRSQGVSAYELYKIIKQHNPSVRYAKNPSKINQYLIKIGKIAFVGAGDISKIAKKLITKSDKKC